MKVNSKKWRERNGDHARKLGRAAKKRYENKPENRLKLKLRRIISEGTRVALGLGTKHRLPARCLRIVMLSIAATPTQLNERFGVKKDGFSVDHIVPLCAFDLTNPEHFMRACFIENLQYITNEENAIKGGWYPDDFDVMTLPCAELFVKAHVEQFLEKLVKEEKAKEGL